MIKKISLLFLIVLSFSLEADDEPEEYQAKQKAEEYAVEAPPETLMQQKPPQSKPAAPVPQQTHKTEEELRCEDNGKSAKATAQQIDQLCNPNHHTSQSPQPATAAASPATAPATSLAENCDAAIYRFKCCPKEQYYCGKSCNDTSNDMTCRAKSYFQDKAKNLKKGQQIVIFNGNIDISFH